MSATRGGWRVALRLARREAVRRRGQTALMLVLICLPVLAVSAAAVVWRTADVSGAEGVDRRMGAAQALVETTDTTRVAQLPDPDAGIAWLGDQRERPTTLDDVRAVLGEDRPVTTYGTASLAYETDRGVADLAAVELDLTDPLTAGFFLPVEGAEVPGRGEVLVTPALVERGPGVGDTLTVLRNGPRGEQRTEVRIAGVVESTASRSVALAVGAPGTFADRSGGIDTGGDTVRRWLVGGAPVGWDDVRALNEAGVLATSRLVLTDPPPNSALPPELLEGAGGPDEATLTALGLVVVMVLLEVVLLAGPAFAVRAKAQAHALALVSAAGGTPGQARRTVLASGVVIGAVGGLVGIALGVLVGWAGVPVAQRLDTTVFGPFEVPWALLAVVAVFGFVSAVLAAVVPAYAASRQDVVAVLAGRRGEGRPSGRSPLVGLLLIAAGAACGVVGSRAGGASPALVGGSALLSVVGMILLVPVAVALLARWAARLPLPVRFAARDAARHRTRTVPAVAAVGATVAGVVALGIAIGSQEAADEQGYDAQLPPGYSSVVLGSDADVAAVEGVLREYLPGAAIAPAVGVVPDDDGDWVELAFTADGADVPYTHWGSLGTAYLVGEEVPSYVAATGDDRDRAADVLAEGGVVLVRGRDAAGPPGPAGLDRVEEIEVVAQRFDEGTGELVPRDRVTRPATTLFVDAGTTSVAAVLSPAAAEALALPTGTSALVVSTPVDEADEEDLNEVLAGMQSAGVLYVERGYQADPAVRIIQLVLAALGGVLMLGGTLTATFLALSDARPDLATMAAVGARPRTRRGVAAAYALVVGLVGALLGAPVGFIPGMAVARPLTREYGTGATVLDVPWLLIGAVVVGLPLLTAAAVGACARSRLPLVARLD